MDAVPEQALRAWIDYLHEMGVYDLYRHPDPRHVLPEPVLMRLRGGLAGVGSIPAPGSAVSSARPTDKPLSIQPTAGQTPASRPQDRTASAAAPPSRSSVPLPPPRAPKLPALPEERVPVNLESLEVEATPTLPPELAAPMPKPSSLESLLPATALVPAADRPAALDRLRAEIGDCTRCPLAYAGRHTIVFGEGDSNAQLLFVGEGPGADEDSSGRPFVGKAGQLLNNMIGAMGLGREQVYIANIVKCRPPGNRTPEFAEATTCSQFLLRQIDIVRPKVIVALGSTAATYVLGVKQSLTSLRGQWFASRGAKVAVTYHPAFLLRDPRQKAEAWKDLQRVMVELGLTPPSRKA